MEFDELLARQLLEGRGHPTVRFYGWSPHAVSLGYHQDEGELDLKRCQQEGIDVVRRPTGGRAILHAHELTYSVVMHSDMMSISRTYEHIGRALAAGLRNLGVDAELAPGIRPTIRRTDRDAAIACFASTSRHEIQYRGKKIVGSAQRRYVDPRNDRHQVVLQHGSVLLGTQHRALADLLSDCDPRMKEIVRATLEAKTTEVETILEREVSIEEVADAMKKAFEEEWSITFW